MPPTKTTRQNGWTIRALRKERGHTVSAFARLLDVAPQTVTNIEYEVKAASTRLVERMARTLGVRPEALDRDAPAMRDLPEGERDAANAGEPVTA